MHIIRRGVNFATFWKYHFDVRSLFYSPTNSEKEPFSSNVPGSRSLRRKLLYSALSSDKIQQRKVIELTCPFWNEFKYITALFWKEVMNFETRF